MLIFHTANGDIIVTLLPVNTRWPWITPAQFRPELVPEELMAQGLTVSYLSENKHSFLINIFLIADRRRIRTCSRDISERFSIYYL